MFAVPGSILSPSARGTNRLIQQGAKLISCVDDILEELRVPLQDYLSRTDVAPTAIEDGGPSDVGEGGLSQAQRDLIGCIESEPVYIDELAQRCELSVTSAISELMTLEMKNLVKQKPGRYYVRN